MDHELQIDDNYSDEEDRDLVSPIITSFHPSLSGSIGTHEDDVVVIHQRGAKWMLGVLGLAICALFLPLEEIEEELVGPIQKDLVCPNSEQEAGSYSDKLSQFEDKVTSLFVDENRTAFLDTFRNTTTDHWGNTYNEMKQGMYEWKSTRFASNLENGDSVFESACGNGLNMLLTLEILNEQGTQDITVYGNDNVQASTELANNIMDSFLPTVGGHKGSICTADSAQLNYIPDDRFDLVFTGCLSPIPDPLELGVNGQERFDQYRELCNSTDWKSQKLIAIMQERQNNWYGKWVNEMIRIAKPGKAVIIEQVTPPLCDSFLDWGGVPKSFWGEAIERYAWNVDPESLDMENDTRSIDRYHVFLRKNRDSYV